MQPYLFPYIGYFQLISAVDTFVLLDDVNFIMRGWINRNNILLGGKQHLFSVPLAKPSQNKLITETKLNFPEKDRQVLLRTIEAAYRKAEYFNDFFPVVKDIILFNEDDLSSFIQNSFSSTLSYLGVEKKILRSSQIEKDNSLSGEDRIVEICKKLGTETYVNLPGGKSLYNKRRFSNENMDLRFIETNSERIIYKQFNNQFVPNLSFLDIAMFNPKNGIVDFMNQYRLVEGGLDV
jgi:hypothetical protein